MAAENLVPPLNLTEALSSLPGMSTIVRLGQIAFVVVIVYISFLIIRSIFQIRYAISMRKLNESVEEINKKMDRIIGSRERKK